MRHIKTVAELDSARKRVFKKLSVTHAICNWAVNLGYLLMLTSIILWIWVGWSIGWRSILTSLIVVIISGLLRSGVLKTMKDYTAAFNKRKDEMEKNINII